MSFCLPRSSVTDAVKALESRLGVRLLQRTTRQVSPILMRETVNFDHIKRHYYMTHDLINPSRIVPKGPLIDWSAPHQRDTLI